MDHIPIVRNPFPGNIIDAVPLLETLVIYGNLKRGFIGFKTFPQDHGYTSTGAKLGEDIIVLDPAFLQSWLFFGLLAEVFGDSEMQFDSMDFINTQSDLPMLTTKEMSRYIWYWQAKIQHEDYDDAVEHAKEVDKCLELVHQITNKLSQSIDATYLGSLANSFLLPIMLIAEHLCRSRREIISRSNPQNLRWDFPPLQKALSKAGWCPGELFVINQDCNLTCKYYLSMIDRNELEKHNPDNISLKKDHSKCTSYGTCQAHQIEMSTYPTRHTIHCQGSLNNSYPACKRIGPPIKEIASILEEGSYTLLTYGFDGENPQVYPAKPENVYVAISHVWSDGLGNKEDNTLQECQVSRIQKLVNELYDTEFHPVKFWIDTFGVPVGPQYDHLKQKAINRMADTYRLANKVLVLDNCLQYCSQECSWVEMNMRIRYCPWMTRVWTMMEGMSNSSVFFQFDGKAMQADDLRDTAKQLRSLLAVSDILEALGTEQVLRNPSALRLARALAMYEPVQKRVDGGEITLILPTDYPEQKAICERWLPSVMLLCNLGEVDEHLRSEIHTKIFCTVVSGGVEPLMRVRGASYQAFVDLARDVGAIPACEYYPPSTLFQDVCRGLQGRTTSRIEDELDCLSLLLGTDISKIEEIQPLHWKTKNRLKWLHSYRILRLILPYVGFDIPHYLLDCQQRRMKVLLAQIKKFPANIIFWDAPRLPFDGWKWAPTSFLVSSINFRILHGGSQGILMTQGLQVQLPGFRLSPLPLISGIEDLVSSITTSVDEEVMIYIHTAEDSDEGRFALRQAWQCLRVVLPNRRHSFNCMGKKRWSDLFSQGTLGRLVALFEFGRSEWDTKGALVERYGVHNTTILAHHIALVDRVPREYNNQSMPIIHVKGTWDPASTWCIG